MKNKLLLHTQLSQQRYKTNLIPSISPLEAPSARASAQKGGKRVEQRGSHAPPPLTVSKGNNEI